MRVRQRIPLKQPTRDGRTLEAVTHRPLPLPLLYDELADPAGLIDAVSCPDEYTLVIEATIKPEYEHLFDGAILRRWIGPSFIPGATTVQKGPLVVFHEAELIGAYVADGSPWNDGPASVITD